MWMNIMYAADDNYAEIMGVSILSLLETNRDVQDIHFFIVEDNISGENHARLRTMIEEAGRQVEFIPKPDINKKLGLMLKTFRWSDSTYSRLFLKDLLAEYPEIHKLLYMDCDTLIVDNLENLWNMDISYCLGAACLECMSNMHKSIIGLKKTDNYINAGMLLLNMDRWFKEDVQEAIIEFIRKHNGRTEYVDQGAINGTISGRLRLADPRYNLTTLAYDFSYDEMLIYRKPESGYCKAEWEAAIKNPAVIHFTTSFLSVRPWYEGSNHPYAISWKQIHDRSPWADCPTRQLKNRSDRDRKELMFRRLPRGLAVHIAGFLHAYVKPILYVLMSLI